MILVFVAVAVVIVVVIGLVAVGGVTGRLAQQPPTSVFDMDEAVDWVADRLPDDVTAQLSFDDVRALIGWHLDYLEAKGVAGENDFELEALASDAVVTADDEGIAYVLGQATDAGLEVGDVQVVEVLEGELAYLRAIGAIGSQVDGPLDPEPEPGA